MSGTQQTEALRLAHALSGGKLIDDSTEWADTLHAAAAELRRIAELEDATDIAIERIAELEEQLSAIGAGDVKPLRKQTAQAAVQQVDTCETCQGNGEVVTDWNRYKHPHPGDKGDEAVSMCQECNGTGEVNAAHPAEGVPAQASEWDGKLPARLQSVLNALRLELPAAVVNDVEFEVRRHYEAMHTSLSTSRRMYGAARDRLEAIDAAQPDPFATTQPAGQGMEQDAARYQALVKSGNFVPSPFDNGIWGLRASNVPSTKGELDAAVDRFIAAQANSMQPKLAT